MRMSGHKTRSVFERYNVTSPGDLREAAAKLDAANRDSSVMTEDGSKSASVRNKRLVS